MVDKVINKEVLSEDLIKEIHRVLTKGTYDERRYVTNNERPGEYKKHDYVIGKKEVGVSPSKVESLMSDLVSQVNEVNTDDIENIILISAYAHNSIEHIHPFSDGNGRVGRTILNYLLMINNLPPIIIYEEDKKYYYEALEVFDEKDELGPTIEFIKYEIKKTWTTKINNNSNKSKPLKFYL